MLYPTDTYTKKSKSLDLLFCIIETTYSLPENQHCRAALKSYLEMRYIRRKIFVCAVRKGKIMW